MIRHIVLFKLSDRTPDGARAQAEALRGALEPLAASVPGVLSLRVSNDPKRVEAGELSPSPDNARLLVAAAAAATGAPAGVGGAHGVS